MMSQNDTTERRLTSLMNRVETLGRNLHTDGRRHNPIRGSFLDGLRAAVNAAFDLGQEACGQAVAARQPGGPFVFSPAMLDQFKALASGDPVKTDLELTHIPCGERLCDVEAGDTMTELVSVMADHVCW